ncbi:hypothetical protein EBB07_28150 [Paenibacillaceae bacterium]|nr:hypothetical protein EBB07_28150 [Paenibacillaceae bacterium]
MIEEEIWKDVAEISVLPNKFGHTYSVSNFGRAKNNSTGRVLKNQLKIHEYEIVNLSNKQYKIHRLVAKLFVHNPDPDKYDVVNHIDRNKTNNHYANLEWCDQSYNMKHASETGAFEGVQTGENNGNAILTDDDVLDIWLHDRSVKYIVKKFNMKPGSAKRVRNKSNWKHLIPVFESMVTKEHIQMLKDQRLKNDGRQRLRKLNDEQVLAVYRKSLSGISNVKLAKEYGVSEILISTIKNKKAQYIVEIIGDNQNT